MSLFRKNKEFIIEEIEQEFKEKKPEIKEKQAPDIKLNIDVLKTYCMVARDFLLRLIQRMGFKDSTLDYFERENQIVPDSLELEDGEVPVKQYDHIATLQTKFKLTRAFGRLQITNKRVLFRANGFSPAGKTIYQQVFDLSKLDGVEIRKDYRFRFCDTLYAFILSAFVMTYAEKVTTALFSADWCYPFMIALALLSCVPMFVWKSRWLEKFLIICLGFACLDAGTHSTNFSWFLELEFSMIGVNTNTLCDIMTLLYFVCLFMYSFKPNMMVEFKCGGGNAIQIRHKDSIFSFKKEPYSGFAEIQPGKDADDAIREVNTIINDIKTLGDLGIEKWRKEV